MNQRKQILLIYQDILKYISRIGCDGSVMLKDLETVRVPVEMNVEGKRGRGRQKKRWMDRIRK